MATHIQVLSKHLYFKYGCPSDWMGVNYEYFHIHHQWKLDHLREKKVKELTTLKYKNS